MSASYTDLDVSASGSTVIVTATITPGMAPSLPYQEFLLADEAMMWF